MEQKYTSLNTLATEIYEANKEKGFWDKERNVGEMLMLITTELAEAMEAHRGRNYKFKDTDTIKDEIEIWKDIKGYEGEYEVSNWGRVKSLDMTVWNGKNYYSKKGRILSPGLGGTGYYTVSLKGKTHKISRLVGKAFLKGWSMKTNVINHINGVKTDDYSNNLEWVSYSDNNMHAIDTGLRNMNKILSKEETVDIAFKCKSKIPHKKIHKHYPQVSLSRIKGISRNHEKYTESFEFEIADSMIRIFDLCGGLGIDIGWHIEQKLKYNKTREKLHGKKY